VRLSLSAGRIAIALNGVPVFDRPLEPDNSRQFGLYHDKRRTAVRVRDVVLSGPWPGSLAPRELGITAARQDPTPPTAAVVLPKVEGWTPVVQRGNDRRDSDDRPLVSLFHNIPLRGDFEASVRLSTRDHQAVELAYGGIGVPTFRGPVKDAGGDSEVRLVVHGRMATFSINGQTVHEQRLPARPDPWLVLRNFPPRSNAVRLTVEGHPAIPDRLELSRSPDLTGWLAADQDSSWSKRGDEIVGRAIVDSRGRRQDSVLRYHRPLLEDGRIEYEFYAEPGWAMVHPALGLQVFSLDSVPVKENAWNRLALIVSGRAVTILLNDAVVLERALGPNDERLFGLFHDAGKTEARVRHVNYQGAWKAPLP
jgi:hypothetical protein